MICCNEPMSTTINEKKQSVVLKCYHCKKEIPSPKDWFSEEVGYKPSSKTIDAIIEKLRKTLDAQKIKTYKVVHFKKHVQNEIQPNGVKSFTITFYPEDQHDIR